ncbi:MAG: diguanylate cyclase [Desulfuromonadaceae bacterium]|nr:diguanylate cyclase [Desulfuromonadaceae bacterium]
MERQKLLVVDDIPENFQVLSNLFMDDYDVFTATSGKEALTAAKMHRPALILLDVMMFGMENYEICTALKDDPGTSDIPVIFVTATSDAESETRAFNVGAVDFIHKPFNKEVVRSRVRLHLELERRAAALKLANTDFTRHRDRLGELNRRLEQSLADIKLSQSRLQVLSTAIEQSPTSVVITGADAIIQYVNPRFSEESGYSSAEAIGQNPRILNSGLTEPSTFRSLWSHLKSGEPWTGEFINRRKSGEIYWEEAHIAPVKDAGGRTTHYVAVKLDISDRKEAQQRLAYMAHHDPLTNLPNRSLFFDLVAQGLALARRNETIMALMYIDLDKFKPINDNYGHEVGDLILQLVARRMSDCVRDSDSVARIGGDEFVVLLLDVGDEEAAVTVAEKIRTSLNQPFDVAGKMLSISSSIGIAIYPEHGSDSVELARNADSAMYHAKQSGRDNVKVFRSA